MATTPDKRIGVLARAWANELKRATDRIAMLAATDDECRAELARRIRTLTRSHAALEAVIKQLKAGQHT